MPPPAPARACNCQNIPNCFSGTLRCANHCGCNNNCEFLAHRYTHGTDRAKREAVEATRPRMEIKEQQTVVRMKR